MDRLACIELPSLPLQLLLQDQPEWKGFPCAVVDQDKPNGELLWVNEKARRLGILPGMRYGSALGLSSELRAAEMPAHRIEDAVQKLVEALQKFSPYIEPCAEEPGVFWIDASGLLHLYESLDVWGSAVRKALSAIGYVSIMSVGFTRFGTYAIAKASRYKKEGAVVFADPSQELAATRRVPLLRIGLTPKTLTLLNKLAVRTVEDFLKLPAAGIKRRFGDHAHRLHQLGTGDLWAPLQPAPPPDPHERVLDLDDEEKDSEKLLFLVKRLLDPLLLRLLSKGQALLEVTCVFEQEHGETLTELIRPAEPTLDAAMLMGLVRLRLESMKVHPGVTRLVMKALGVRATVEQLRLFVEKPKRDLKAANRAIARVRAAFGNDVVVRARLENGHLPEARFSYEAMTEVPEAQPRVVPRRSLVRYFKPTPLLLPPRPAREPDGWLVRGISHGPVSRSVGPYVLSGGWWRKEVERDYYFVELKSGSLCWVYYDKRRRRWFMQGKVA
ncbi:MAG: DNA polymerase Y family protein [Sandaracinaceae bacterium]|nr:DNA polymerase Y family protein [Sandaracinaceae bacterium]